MMTPGSPHTAAKSTHRLLLARRVNFLVTRIYIVLGLCDLAVTVGPI